MKGASLQGFIALAILIPAASLSGQTRSWERIREIAPGEKIVLEEKAGKRHGGILVNWSEDSLTWQDRRNQVRTVHRTAIGSVTVARKGSRLRAAG